MKILPIIFGALLLSTTTFCQTQFWSDTFEDAGAPSSGTRVASSNSSTGGPPATRYFWRCGASDIASVNTYSGFQGSKFWAGEDHRLSPISQTAEQSITWSSINISGKSDLAVKALFASGNGAGNSWDITPNSLTNDFLSIEYRIDGGAWQNGICFMASQPTISTPLSINSNPGVGTGKDSVGDGITLLNSAVFSEFIFYISGTGSTLDLKLRASSNSTSEEWAVDNIRLFYGQAPLPVTLINLKGGISSTGNMLSWVSENEINNAGFEVERSTDGIQFSKIGYVGSKGNSNRKQYNYTDITDVPGTAYYRLKQVDINGTYTYSDIVLIRRSQNINIRVSPNPFTNKLYIETNEPIGDNLKNIELSDISGKKFRVNTNRSANSIIIDTETLPAGVYVLLLNNGVSVTNFMVVKQ